MVNELERIRVGQFEFQKFTFKQEHLDLLQTASVGAWTWGNFSKVIGFGGSRPFGNSDVWHDMAEILKRPMPNFDDVDEWPKGFVEEMEQLYYELEFALAVILNRQSFELGTFYKTTLVNAWMTKEELKAEGADLGDA